MPRIVDVERVALVVPRKWVEQAHGISAARVEDEGPGVPLPTNAGDQRPDDDPGLINAERMAEATTRRPKVPHRAVLAQDGTQVPRRLALVRDARVANDLAAI